MLNTERQGAVTDAAKIAGLASIKKIDGGYTALKEEKGRGDTQVILLACPMIE